MNRVQLRTKTAYLGHYDTLLLSLFLLFLLRVDGATAYTLGQWTTLTSSSGPVKRASPIMGAFYQPPVFQGSVGKRMLVLFGGDNGALSAQTPYNDLWYYDVGTVMEIFPPQHLYKTNEIHPFRLTFPFRIKAANLWTQQQAPNPPPLLVGQCGCVAGPADAPRLYIFGWFPTSASPSIWSNFCFLIKIGGATPTYTYYNTLYSIDLRTSSHPSLKHAFLTFTLRR